MSQADVVLISGGAAGIGRAILTDVMQVYWTAFASNTDPNVEGLVPWPRFQHKDYPVIEFGDSIRVIEPPETGLCASFNGLPKP